MSSSSPTFLLIDGHALIYRAYYAFPNLTDHTGKLVNAVYGFTRILLKAINDFTPEYLAIAFDHPKPTFRHESFAGYKAHRKEMPDDLQPQIKIIKQMVDALNIPRFEVAGFEADDLIGTLSRKVKINSLMTIIVTGDKDLLQLVDDATHVWMPARGKYGHDLEYDKELVKKKMGVTPSQVIDLKSLMGDSSDNIPGVKGVGKKTALKLIQEFGSLEGVYEKIGEESQVLTKSVVKKLVAGKENAFASKELVTIKLDVPIEFELESCRVSGYNKEKAVALLKDLDFKSLVNMLPADEFERGVQEALF